MLKPLTLLLTAALLAAPTPRWLTLNQAANAAIQATDYAKLHATLLDLLPLMPGNPRNAYNLAASNAKLGNPTAALQGLRDLSATGLIYNFAADDDFASLKTTPDFAAILKRVDANRQPVHHASLHLTLTESDLIPEDLAYDPRTRRTFLSSVRKRKILTTDGREFAHAEWPILALAADPQRRILWATTGWVPHCDACKREDRDHTALLAFNLDTGALQQRIESPLKGLLGDMTISHHGDLYISEGIYGAVLFLKAGAHALERLDTEGDFPSPQTPALSADERTLYIPDYARGIAAMNLATRALTWLQPVPSIALSGIDGLYVTRKSFIAVQNGTNPPRIVRFSLDLQHQQILEANTPGLGEPTHGHILGNQFLFLANTGWSAYDQNGIKKPGTPPVQSAIWKLDLSE